jgi:hypothetical protein
MGSACSTPTNQEIERSRISKNQNKTYSTSNPKDLPPPKTSSSSKNISSSIHLNSPRNSSFNKQIPESYSDSKMKEIEIFQRIINQAEKFFEIFFKTFLEI